MNNWTKEKPTESGIYWAKSGLETVICKLWPDGELEFIGTTHTKRLNDVPLDCEWSGPIEPNGWIKCEDQTPTLDEIVLLFFPLNRIQCTGFYVPRLNQFDLGAERIDAAKVSHWRKLPNEPPSD